MSASLDHLARRVELDPTFLGHQLHAYQRFRGLTDADLAAELGCNLETLTRVRLCGAIRVGHFAADCSAVAGEFGLNVEALERAFWPW